MHSVNPFIFIPEYWQHRTLIKQLTKREIIGRFQETHLGFLWVVLEPVLMLTVYVVVFKFIFGRYWYSEEETTLEFAIILFSGLLVFNLFREAVSNAPRLVVKNVNYVKKVVFPLEILPLVSILTGLYHLGISISILCVAYVLVYGHLHLDIVYIPVILLPYILLIFGICMFLASMGVFLRDIAQIIGMLIMSTLFLSAIFYPIESVPEKYQLYFHLNPVAFTVEQFRSAVILGHPPDWKWLIGYYPVSIFISWAGFFWFQKTRKGFADVL